jgi:hypothetical protein
MNWSGKVGIYRHGGGYLVKNVQGTGTWGPLKYPQLACGSGPATFQAAAYHCGNESDPAYRATSAPQVLYPAPCAKTDRSTTAPSCPLPKTVGKPINVGSGDTSYDEPLFTIDQEPFPLSFNLSYHSSAPIYPALDPKPLGSGWSFTFGETLRKVDANGVRLYHVGGDGIEVLYDETYQNGVWYPTWPPDVNRTVRRAGSTFEMADRDGSRRAFDEVHRALAMVPRPLGKHHQR